MRMGLIGLHPAQISGPASTVDIGVAVERLSPEAAPGDADAIMPVGRGSEIAHHQHDFAGFAVPANKADNAVIGVAHIDPLEPGRIEVVLPQGGGAAVVLI